MEERKKWPRGWWGGVVKKEIKEQGKRVGKNQKMDPSVAESTLHCGSLSASLWRIAGRRVSVKFFK